MALRLHGWKRRLLSLGAGALVCASTGCTSTNPVRHSKATPITKPMGPGNTVMSPPLSPAFNNLANNAPGIINKNPSAGPQLMNSPPAVVTTTVISPTNITSTTPSSVPPMPVPPVVNQVATPTDAANNPPAMPTMTPPAPISTNDPPVTPTVAPEPQTNTARPVTPPVIPTVAPEPQTNTARPVTPPVPSVPQYQQVPQMPTMPNQPMMAPTTYGQPMLVVPTQYGLQYYAVQQMPMPVMQHQPYQGMPQPQQGQMMLPQVPQYYQAHPQMLMTAPVPNYQTPAPQMPVSTPTMPVPAPGPIDPSVVPNNTMSNIKAPPALPTTVTRPATNAGKGPVLPTSGMNLSLDPFVDSRATPARSVAEGPLKRPSDPSLNLPEDILPAPINAQQR